MNLLLLVDLCILTITLGLMTWASSVLSRSMSKIVDYDYVYGFGYGADLPGIPFSTIIVQIVTGYASTSTRQAQVITERTTQTYIANGKTIVSTPTPIILTRPAYLYGIDATGTKRRTYSTAGFSEPIHLRQQTTTLMSTPAATPLPNRAQTTGTYLGPEDRWDTPASVPEYWKYNSVTVDHGFDRYFLQAGVDYFASQGQEYLSYHLDRVRGLTALIALALVAIVARMATSLLYIVQSRRKKYGEDSTARLRRRSGWTTLVFAILLILTFLSFWAIYGFLTYRSQHVETAQASLAKFGYGSILRTSPWFSKTIALIVSWALSSLTSFVVTFIFLTSRISTKDDSCLTTSTSFTGSPGSSHD